MTDQLAFAEPLRRFAIHLCSATTLVVLAACGGGNSMLPSTSGATAIHSGLRTQSVGAQTDATTPAPSPSFNPWALPVLTDTNPSTAGVFLGADCGAQASVACPTFSTQFRHGLAMGTVYTDWAEDMAAQLSVYNLSSWEAQGTIPDITWQPTSPLKTITLAGIASGEFDAYITKSADELATFNQPVFLRPFHEFNTTHYSWGLANNGADATADANFVAAWRHIVTIFRAQKATKVKFVWCFNSTTIPAETWNEPASAYPGDAYVDWIAFDAYNQGSSSNGLPWNSFATTINGVYKTAVAISAAKPIMIGELASNEYGDGGPMKASWVTQMFATLTASNDPYPNLRAISWFEGDQNFLYDSKTTTPVYQAFEQSIRGTSSSGVLAVRSNGNALFSITAP